MCKLYNRLIRISVLDAVAHAVLDMALEDNLSYFMKCRFYRIDLRQYILARHVLIHHTFDRLHLTDDLFQVTVKIICIHTLFHFASSLFQIRHMTIVLIWFICVFMYLAVYGEFAVSPVQ